MFRNDDAVVFLDQKTGNPNQLSQELNAESGQQRFDGMQKNKTRIGKHFPPRQNLHQPGNLSKTFL
jgi:hypothetical protein